MGNAHYWSSMNTPSNDTASHPSSMTTHDTAPIIPPTPQKDSPSTQPNHNPLDSQTFTQRQMNANDGKSPNDLRIRSLCSIDMEIRRVTVLPAITCTWTELGHVPNDLNKRPKTRDRNSDRLDRSSRSYSWGERGAREKRFRDEHTNAMRS